MSLQFMKPKVCETKVAYSFLSVDDNVYFYHTNKPVFGVGGAVVSTKIFYE